MSKLKNKLNLKSLTIGITLGVTVSIFIPVFATVQQYILTKVNYPILVNGQEYVNEELPVLNWEGNTFIPLRAVGDILEVKVNWNEELKRVEIGDVVDVDNKIINIQNDYMAIRELHDKHPNYYITWSDDERTVLAMYIKINNGESSQMLINNIKYTVNNIRVYISKETYENDLRPLIQ